MSTHPYLMVKGTVDGSTPWRSRLRRRSGHEWMTTFLTWTTRKTRFNIHFCRKGKGHPSFAHAYGHVRPTDISLLESSIRTRRPSAARSPSPTMRASAAASLLLSPFSCQGSLRPKTWKENSATAFF